MKVAIVVPYSWSYWGGVVEHAEHQAEALERLGIETRIVAGHDPPHRLTTLMRPHAPRHQPLPRHVISIGTTVPVPTNGSLSNIVLDPRAFFRFRGLLDRERFDLLHLHEPLVPIAPMAALALARQPVVATFHAAGALRWLTLAKPIMGFLLDRLDHRIAVSASARESAAQRFPGDYTIIPNGVSTQPSVSFDGRDDHVVFIGRADQRKGLAVLLRAWPAVHRATGARLRIVGADPGAVQTLLRRACATENGVDVLGVVDQDTLTEELLRAKLLVACSTSGESFGMVITRAFACGTPVVASDIPGYRDVVTDGTGLLVPPGDSNALTAAVTRLFRNERARQRLARTAHATALGYNWDRIGSSLVDIYEDVLHRTRRRLPARAAA